MTDIAFLGLGAMGSRMAPNLVKTGHRVAVWNRSPKACDPLIALGARRAASPREAVSGAEFVIAILRDDEASRRVWLDAKDGALAGMRKGAVAIESSTVTPDWSRTLGRHAAEHGVGCRRALQSSKFLRKLGHRWRCLATADQPDVQVVVLEET